jgi:hypothetical protein
LDLVITDAQRDEVIVMAGDGTGDFDLRDRIPVTGTPSGVEIGEFGGGPKLDLAITDIEDNEVTLILQGSGGEFSVGPSFAVEDEPHRLASADLDGNGHRDLVVSNEESDTVSVLLQQEDGFGSPSSHVVGNGPTDVEIVDLDGDGMLDIVVATTAWVSILQAVVPGAFGTYEAYAADAHVGSTKAEDLDDDGDEDLVLSTSSPGPRVMLQQADGSFDSVPAGFTYFSVNGSVIGDFDGDGEADYAASGALEGFHVLLGEVLRIEPVSVNFGPTYAGRSTSGSFLVRNTGSDPVSVEGAASRGQQARSRCIRTSVPVRSSTFGRPAR